MIDVKIGLVDMFKMGDYYIIILVENGIMLIIILFVGFDEWIIGYWDCFVVLLEIWYDEIMMKNGIFRLVIIMEGKVVGKWEKLKKCVELDGDFWDCYI